MTDGAEGESAALFCGLTTTLLQPTDNPTVYLAEHVIDASVTGFYYGFLCQTDKKLKKMFSDGVSVGMYVILIFHLL